MTNPIINFIAIPLIVAFLISTVLTPISIFVLNKLGIVDDPKIRKHPGVIHKKPIPRGGGIPLFLGVFIAGFLFLPINHTTIALFLASFLALLIGVIDDKFEISPYLRFVINFICAVLVVWAGVSVPFITNPLGGILFLNKFSIPFSFMGISGAFLLSDAIAIIWIVWVMNMLNWSKGVDGQMPGIIAVSAIIIGLLSFRFGIFDEFSQISATLSFIIAGSAIGFLLYNFHPAKIFPGYGATSIYLLLAVVSILSSAKLATAILVMGVPLADGAFVIGRRILSGRSPFWHDKKHLHHLLLSLGFGQRRIALFYWLISAIFGAISLVLSSRGKAFAIIMLVIIVGGILLSLNYLLKKKNVQKNV